MGMSRQETAFQPMQWAFQNRMFAMNQFMSYKAGPEERLPLHQISASNFQPMSTIDALQPQYRAPVNGPNLNTTNLKEQQGRGGIRPRTGQLTIFYDGSVHVYDQVPSDKAQEIMLLASKGSNQSSNTINQRPEATASTQHEPPNNVLRTETLVFDLAKAIPQARKASLARFLEKRKERITNVAPYANANNPSENTRWTKGNSAGSSSDNMALRSNGNEYLWSLGRQHNNIICSPEPPSTKLEMMSSSL